jgi:8-amino-7-oxononanoate synthase
VPDFTSSLYLGLRHESAALRPWPALTAGAPAALTPVPGARRAAGRLAALLGTPRALLAPSTLHVFTDLFCALARPPSALYVDAEAYPIARWGVARAAAAGVPVRVFPHRDVRALARLVERGGRRPVVVADGLCPACGRVAPLAALLDTVGARGGLVVLDDTQALGVLGASPGPVHPYGAGGAGAAAWHGVRGDDALVLAASLAKGLGAPVAVLAAAEAVLDRFEAASGMLVHCSPPSVAVICAAEHALDVNEREGDDLRARLAGLVRRFRAGARARGFSVAGGLFPVQTLELGGGAADLHARLLERGVRTVLHGGPRLSFLITARHTRADVDQALAALAHSAARSAIGARP